MAAASRTGDNPIRRTNERYVDRALDRLLGRRQRRPLKLDPHRIADVGARALEQLCESSERHSVTGNGRTRNRRANHRTLDMRSGSTNSTISSMFEVRQIEMTLSIASSADDSSGGM